MERREGWREGVRWQAEWILSCVPLKHFTLILAAEMEADSFL